MGKSTISKIPFKGTAEQEQKLRGMGTGLTSQIQEVKNNFAEQLQQNIQQLQQNPQFLQYLQAIRKWLRCFKAQCRIMCRS